MDGEGGEVEWGEEMRSSAVTWFVVCGGDREREIGGCRYEIWGLGPRDGLEKLKNLVLPRLEGF